MTDILNFLDRSSWGVLPAHPTLVLLLLLGAALAAAAGAGRASWRDERGYGLVEALIAVLLVVVILVVLFHFL